MNIHLKTCKKCGKKFDIGTNKDDCPECRLEGKDFVEVDAKKIKVVKGKRYFKPVKLKFNVKKEGEDE